MYEEKKDKKKVRQAIPLKYTLLTATLWTNTAY